MGSVEGMLGPVPPPPSLLSPSSCAAADSPDPDETSGAGGGGGSKGGGCIKGGSLEGGSRRKGVVSGRGRGRWRRRHGRSRPVRTRVGAGAAAPLGVPLGEIGDRSAGRLAVRIDVRRGDALHALTVVVVVVVVVTVRSQDRRAQRPPHRPLQVEARDHIGRPMCPQQLGFWEGGVLERRRRPVCGLCWGDGLSKG